MFEAPSAFSSFCLQHVKAMTYDVLHHQLHGNKFKVEGQEKEAVLDDNDELWVHTRYKHIAHVTDILKEGTDELLKKSSKKSSSGVIFMPTYTHTLPTHLHVLIAQHTHTHTEPLSHCLLLLTLSTSLSPEVFCSFSQGLSTSLSPEVFLPLYLPRFLLFLSLNLRFFALMECRQRSKYEIVGMM